jgi:predicted RNA-binding Zn-ribbon protein involved in translation (DUF1610 family)
MSNKRKLKVADAGTAERCTSCGRRIGANADALRLRTGQVICPRCRQNGELPRLACGHYALPGTLVSSDSDDLSTMQCPRCSPVAGKFGNGRFGLPQRGQ